MRGTASKFESVTRHSDQRKKKHNLSGVALQPHLEQFDPVCTTHPVTFDNGTVPRLPKVSNFLQNSSSSAPFESWEEQAVHLDFLPVSSLLLVAVTLETAVGSCFHLAGIWIVLSPHSNVGF